ncbi:hypothetical protein M433DRAFT_450322 [Acidomyces richmondensis BFW]|nr:hypothetical protein M433DRAFT_450322 [Acidomyces richmondensis BFW]
MCRARISIASIVSNLSGYDLVSCQDNIMFLLLFVTISCLLSSATAQGTLLAELDYGRFQGAYSAEYNISYWMKIPLVPLPLARTDFEPLSPLFQSSTAHIIAPSLLKSVRSEQSMARKTVCILGCIAVRGCPVSISSQSS